MRASLPCAALVLVVAAATPVAAQRAMWTDRITADVEIVEVLDAPLVRCGIVAVYATLRARVIAVRSGTWPHPELRLRWLSCGQSRESLTAQLVGHRYQMRLRRWMHPPETRLPLDRQPAWWLFGDATELAAGAR